MQSCEIHLTVKAGSLAIDAVPDLTGERASRIRQFVVRPGDEPGLEDVTITFARLPRAHVEAVARRLRENPTVIRVRSGPDL